MTVRDPSAHQRIAGALVPAVLAVSSVRLKREVDAVLARAVRNLPRAALVTGAVAAALAWLRNDLHWALPVGMLAGTLAGTAVAATLVRARRIAVGADAAALACDRANDNRDRLSAALDLSGAEPVASAQGEGLARAAIEDGLASLARVDTANVGAQPAREPLAWRRALLAVALLCAWCWWLPSWLGDRAPQGFDDFGAAPQATGAARSERDPATARRDEELRRAEPVAQRQATPPAAQPQERREDKAPPKDEPSPAQPAASGAAAAAGGQAGEGARSGAPKAAPSAAPGASQSGGGQGAAAASAAEPTPQQPQPVAKAAKPQPKKPQPKTESQQDAKAAESAGAPSGPSRGSGRMAPVGNKRQDLTRGQEREDVPDIEDEPIEDETDEQQQRGGVMPMRRQDQRPAARELSISGDGPPDQGRGGPTPPKKSRGTASLVLGLRLPDQVRGQPNPGTAKTSIEQIPPRPQDADAGTATPGGTGRPATVQSQRPPLAAPALLDAYHRWLRQQEAPANPSPVPNQGK